ncbi:serine/threonine-protein kinase [Kamptonema formosum]|uniref:serine/threonine-protein kinase n=1 Tax=Kamptonema formosum TaxID=331992 RepID=UPI0003493E25|nr:serine/threonine-protein kinase [Oscillatoria sp. PCC 10802]
MTLPILLNNRFRLIQEIAAGGFGQTFKAVDEHSPNQSKCLVKQFRRQSLTGIDIPDILPRLEVESLSLLKHPQIPMLIACFERDNDFWWALEFIEGIYLQHELQREGAFSEAKIWQLLNELLTVLKYIHAQNVIHRDITPSNIIRPLDNSKPLVLVNFEYSNPRATANLCMGTSGYMAPEQEKRRAVFASDLYSLGVTCIHLLTNAYRPDELFDDATKSWVWRSRCNRVSDSLAVILDKLLELDTAKRYQSAEEVMRDIAAVSRPKGQSTGNRQAPPPPSPAQPKSKVITIWDKIAALGAAAQGLAALVGILIALGLIKVFIPSPTDESNKVPISTGKDSGSR